MSGAHEVAVVAQRAVGTGVAESTECAAVAVRSDLVSDAPVRRVAGSNEPRSLYSYGLYRAHILMAYIVMAYTIVAGSRL